MAGDFSTGDLISGGSFLIKMLKVVFIAVFITSFILYQTHLFAFSFLELLGYDTSLFHINGKGVFNSFYNVILNGSSKTVKGLGFWGLLLVMIFIPSMIYIAYHHSKIKKFPGIIFRILLNQFLLLVVIMGVLFGFSFISKSKIFPLIVIISIIGYTFFLLFFKSNRKVNLKDIKPKIKTKTIKEDFFVFETNKQQIMLENPYRGVYIQGGAGSGKSASVFEPIINQCGKNNFTGMLYDFKSPELTNKLQSAYLNSNIKVKNIDFKQPFLSERINPISPKYLSKSVVAIEYAQVLINNLMPETIKKNDFWSNNAKMILASVIWYLRNSHPDKCTIPHVISLILHNSADELVNKVSQDYEAGGMIASLKESIDRGSERTVAGMLSTLQNALSNLNSQDVFWILSQDNVDLHLNNPENPSFLCLGNDSTLSEVYRPVISLIMTVALRQMNKSNQLKSVVLVDEAPTVFIPNIDQIPATARSNKIATIFGVQDYSQLQDKYGEDKAQVLVSNLGSHFYGRVVNPKSAEMIQKIFSKEDRTFISKSDGSGTSGKLIHLNSNSSSGSSENIQERDRVKINDLIHLESGEFYGIIAEGEPREFLKTKFKYAPIQESYINTRIPVNADIIKENYFRIINECKQILNG